MKILTFFTLSMIFLFCGCNSKKIEDKSKSFEILMGSQLPAWKYVQTEEDFQNLAFFKKIYEKNIDYLQTVSERTSTNSFENSFEEKIFTPKSNLQTSSEEHKIPKIIHFIWLGPNPFPRESVENIRSWIAHHPDWVIKFWTDRKRPLPHPKMELHLIENFSFSHLKPFFYSSDNFGEKSDVLRYEILYNEGGIYVDHDVKCMQSFDLLHRAYDLYCGLEVPYPTSLSTSISPTNNIVGAKVHHPVLLEVMNWLKENWNQIEEQYPGKDRDAVINRVSHRTFFVLGEIFKLYANKWGNIDIAFPSYYFNAPKEEDALFARHQYMGSWFENESVFEKMVRKRLMMLSKKVNKLLLSLSILAGLNIFGFFLIGYFMVRRRRI